MKNHYLLAFILGLFFMIGCAGDPGHSASGESHEGGEFVYKADQFADLKILRYRVPGFEQLPLKQKKLLYYLYQASLSGRDIMYDQNFKHNLAIRRTLEAIINSGKTDESGDWEKFMVYAKRVWFSNGIHHHYSNDKIMPDFSQEYFAELVNGVDPASLPLAEGQSVEDFLATLTPVMFDPAIAPKKVNLAADIDHVTQSAVNFYEGVTEAEVDAYYAGIIDKDDPEPISYGLNTKVVKENGQIVEKVWKIGGMYSGALTESAKWLEKALDVTENDAQRKAIELLIKYYQTGDLADFDDYSIAWVGDSLSNVDMIHGFIEVYNDPKGYKGSFEAVVSVRDPEATKRIKAIGDQAQWFEDNSPLMEAHKKKNVKGISAKVINVVIESGDSSPSTPIGINLPNANWIRANHGSKSVNLANIVSAYEEASSGSGFLQEFAYSEEEIENTRKYGSIADLLHTDMHEVIGHASGQINPGVGTPKETMKNYASTMEEGRADLVALYYILDQKLVDMGLMESLQVGRTAYDDYIRNGMMTQLTRLKLGDVIEEAHMRNRAWVSHWSYEQGKEDNVIEKVKKDGKTYFKINDYEKLREIFGRLLRETQRIKSEGDFEAAKALVEGYGVQVDPELHKEVLERYAALKLAPYSGFINPQLEAVMDGDEIKDVVITYPKDFVGQMLYYAKNYSFLPTYN